MKEKIEIKPLEKKPEKAPETQPEIDPVRSRARAESASPEDRGAATSNGIETWEDEGGTTAETQEEAPAEVPETVVEKERVKIAWQELVAQAKEEFPEEIKRIISKASRKEKLNSQEISALDAFTYHWFRFVFGIKNKRPPSFEKGLLTLKKPAKQEKAKPQKLTEKQKTRLTELSNQKRNRIEQLHRALKNLDAGESVEEFIDETRRVVYYDEENKQFFVEENDRRKVVGIGDVVSDYAWGIKYLPDSTMTDENAYRALAKRILTNETRRDIEKIHNLELIIQRPSRDSAASFVRIWPKVKETFKKAGARIEKNKLLGDVGGWIIEVAVREFISRISLNTKLDIVVSRATVEEDADYKYDFKVRVKYRTRGVDVKSENVSTLGFQLKSEFKRIGVGLSSRQMKKGATIVVDEILTLKVPSKEFLEAINKWFEAGEPTGGPEQFLSPELKKAILKAVTEKLVDIPQEIFDQIVEVPITAKP